MQNHEIVEERSKEFSKEASLKIIALIYLVAFVVGLIICMVLPFSWWLNLLFADVIATVIVFGFSCYFSNASVYDPYWSVQPLVIAALYAFGHGTGGAGVLVIILLCFWGIRLTGNWVYTFKGITRYEDWRYISLRESTGAFYPIINFLGIHMVPTLIVYACTLPAVYLVREGVALKPLTCIFLLLGFVSVYLELSADLSMHRFKREGRKGFIRDGLWKHSRHPNYLGEISFWWFIALAAFSVSWQHWYLLIGAALNTILFLTVSIPMAEKHQSRKPGYREYRRRTRMLLPIEKRG